MTCRTFLRGLAAAAGPLKLPLGQICFIYFLFNPVTCRTFLRGLAAAAGPLKLPVGQIFLIFSFQSSDMPYAPERPGRSSVHVTCSHVTILVHAWPAMLESWADGQVMPGHVCACYADMTGHDHTVGPTLHQQSPGTTLQGGPRWVMLQFWATVGWRCWEVGPTVRSCPVMSARATQT